jgi:hypothetical protein
MPINAVHGAARAPQAPANEATRRNQQQAQEQLRTQQADAHRAQRDAARQERANGVNATA